MCELKYDDLILFDKNSKTYNIGDLLNMPFFFSGWNSNPHHDYGMYDLFNNVSDVYPNSILHIYKSTRLDELKENENIPNIDRLLSSVDIFSINKNIHVNIDISTLYVHLRTGDKLDIEDIYVDKIYKLHKEFYNNIIILTGIHNDVRYLNEKDKLYHLNKSLKKLHDKGITYTLNLDSPDNHLYIMRNCKNLLVHKGGFSIIGAIIFNGNKLYITNLLEPLTAINNNNFLSHINRYIVI